MVGKNLSHYKILEELGRGGMGIVYKAEDTNLNRTVAVKVLPAAAMANEDDRSRFYREARAAAALAHQNIAVIHAIDEAVPVPSESSEAFLFIAMEYIEGGTLEDRISDSPLKLRDAQSIAVQIASALDAAHSKDIVHRDIKPGNVMWNAKGSAKVLDFGLAQTSQSTKLTKLGSTLGTIAYMSPEQAKGEEVDHRSDIWSLGAVMYEMVSGRLPFSSEYEQAAVYSILNEDPEPLTALRTGVPMEFERIVDKCLAKDPKRRYQHADELAADLEGIDFSTTTSTRTTTRIPTSVQTRHTATPVVTALAIGGILIGAFAAWLLLRPDNSADQYRPISLTRVTYEAETEYWPTIHPDGDIVVYGAGPIEDTRLYYRSTGLSEPTRLVRGLDEDQRTPDFSPDGTEILFESRGSIYRVNSLGGPANVVVRPRPNESSLLFPTWSPTGDQIAFVSADDSVFVYDLDSRQRTAITSIQRVHSPAWSPDGSRLALVTNNSYQALLGTNLLPSSIVIVNIENGRSVTVTEEDFFMDTSPKWTPGGEGLLYLSTEGGGNDIWYQRIRSNGEPKGNSERISVGLELHWLDISTNPVRLVAGGLSYFQNIWRAPIRDGVVATPSDFEQIISGHQVIEHAIMSPDGTKLAFTSNIRSGTNIFVADPDGTNITQVTFDRYSDFVGAWSPDARFLAFHRYINGTRNIYTVSLDDNDVTEVYADSLHDQYAKYSHDGLLMGFARSTGADFEYVTLSKNEAGEWGDPVILIEVFQEGAAFSPVSPSVVFLRDRNVFFMDLDSHRITQLTSTGDADIFYDIAFSRDGERVLFWRTIDGSNTVWSIRLSDGALRQVADMGENKAGAGGFSVTETHVYFTVENTETDILVMDLPE